MRAIQSRLPSLAARVWALVRSDLFGSMSAILRVNIAMQALSLLFVPILTRVYGPTEYGLFALFTVLSAYFTQLSILRYDVAIDLPGDDRDALPLLHLCFLLTLIPVVGTFLLALFAGPWLGRLMGQESLSRILIFLPVSVALASYGALIGAWFARQRNFTTPSNIRLVAGVVDGLSKLGLGLLGFLRFGQVIGSLISNIVLVGCLEFSARRGGQNLFRDFNVRRALAAGWAYRKFPLLNFPTSILEMTALSLPAVMLAASFGPTQVGLFFVADRLTQAPAVAIASAIRPVFKRHAAIAVIETGHCRPLLLRTLALTGAIGLCVLFGLVVVTPPLFALVFKPEWQGAVWMVQVLALARAMDIFVNPVTPVMLVQQTHFRNLAIQLFLLGGAAIAFLIGGMMNSIIVALVGYTAVLCAKYCVELAVCWTIAGHPRMGGADETANGTVETP